MIESYVEIKKDKKSEIAILQKELSFNDKNTIFFHLNNELESSIFDNIKLDIGDNT